MEDSHRESHFIYLRANFRLPVAQSSSFESVLMCMIEHLEYPEGRDNMSEKDLLLEIVALATVVLDKPMMAKEKFESEEDYFRYYYLVNYHSTCMLGLRSTRDRQSEAIDSAPALSLVEIEQDALDDTPPAL